MPDYIYQDRAVIFLDVLGFQDRLKEFEEEAISNANNLPEKYEYPVSEKANEFINTFKSVTSVLDNTDLTYYLFSDNICITMDYVKEKNLLVDILYTVADLFYAFAQKGYFLRGAIDIGKFIDDEQIAIGVPLANAYKLENNIAIYPRILISEKYKTTLDNYAKEKLVGDGSVFSMRYLISKSCELYYLNVFFNAAKYDDKVQYFMDLKKAIEKNLGLNETNEKIFLKYKWLAEEFNNFLINYVRDAYLVEVLEQNLQDSEKSILRNLRIKIS